METKANYLMIGLFTLAGLLGSLVFVLWLAKFEVDRQYAYYEILFENVSGLANAGDVRYNGLPVGQVVGLKLDSEDPSQVRVRVELRAETPVKTDTVATLQSLGVTGVSFVALSGGSPEAERLAENEVIRSEASVLQSVLEGAPVLMQRAVTLLENINTFVDEENRVAVRSILDNVASASGRLDRALEDFETLSSDLSTAAGEVADFSGRLEALADTAEVTLVTATETLTRAQDAIERGATTIDTAKETLTTAEQTFASVTRYVEGDLTALTQQGTTAAARIEETLDTMEAPALAALETADAALAEAERTFAAANKVLEEDIDGIVVDLRAAVQTFTSAVDGAAGNIDGISQEVLAASQSAASFAATLEAAVVSNERQITRFLQVGLPEFLFLTEEARQLVRNLDRFIDRIDRDPARYFFGTQGSEFRR